jgi:predicted nuclease of predicted toxin-antitoxin system
VKFLIDECLSPGLAGLARERGFAGSLHVAWIGLSGAKDWTVARRAVDGGFVLVTNNRLDFLRLYTREILHGGLVCLNAAHGTMSREQQRRLFALALSRLDGPEPYNEVLEITLGRDGGVTVERFPLPDGE